MANAPWGSGLPCHRVVNSKGEMLPGNQFGGPDAQRSRLEQEGVVFRPSGRIDLRRQPVDHGMNRNARNFADLLASLPPEAWETALRRQPEWFGLEDRFPVFGEGPFAVLLTLAGLNAFQLKGKAETGYWTQFPGHVCAMDACSAPNDLAARLEPF